MGTLTSENQARRLEAGATATMTELNSPRLILIGTVHGDPRGYARAWGLLQRLKPDLVTVEVSRFSLRYRERQEANWQRLLQQVLAALPGAAAGHLALRRLAAQVALPFEVRVARDYAEQYQIPWRPLDLGGPSRRHLRRYARELLAPKNLRALLTTPDEPLGDHVAREYRRAHAERRPVCRIVEVDPETRRRERLQARRLRSCLARYVRVAHLGGWEHLVSVPLSSPFSSPEAGGLWRELRDLAPPPLVILLDDAEPLASGGPS